MPLGFVLDENLPHRLWRALSRHNTQSEYVMPFRSVIQQTSPLGSKDSEILRWAERENRILLTLDKNTLPGLLNLHRSAGGRCPGILTIRPGVKIPEIIFHLAVLAHASEAWEWQDRIDYIP